VLNEDVGVDDLYGKCLLTNLFANQTTAKNTNEVHHSF